MRTELRKRGVKQLKVVYSKEKTLTPQPTTDTGSDVPRVGAARRQTPGSTAYVPAVAGLILAGEVINDLTGKHGVMA